MKRLLKHPNIVPAVIFAILPLLACTADYWILFVFLSIGGFIVGISL